MSVLPTESRLLAGIAHTKRAQRDAALLASLCMPCCCVCLLIAGEMHAPIQLGERVVETVYGGHGRYEAAAARARAQETIFAESLHAMESIARRDGTAMHDAELLDVVAAMLPETAAVLGSLVPPSHGEANVAFVRELADVFVEKGGAAGPVVFGLVEHVMGTNTITSPIVVATLGALLDTGSGLHALTRAHAPST